MKFRILLIISVILFYSCTDSGELCLSNQQSVQVQLKSKYTKKDTTLKLTVYSTGIDSMVYDTIDVKNLFLPLSMINDTSEFILKVKTSRDTLRFIHSKELNYISKECGFIFDFDLDTILYSDYLFIDSISIINKSIIYGQNINNVEVYIY